MDTIKRQNRKEEEYMDLYTEAKEKKNIVVCAYVRVSTDSEAQYNSYENQQSYFTETISQRDNYELYKIYSDRGLSGI